MEKEVVLFRIIKHTFGAMNNMFMRMERRPNVTLYPGCRGYIPSH